MTQAQHWLRGMRILSRGKGMSKIAAQRKTFVNEGKFVFNIDILFVL
jgi:hypothetical protein